MMFSDESVKSGVDQFDLTQSLHIVDFIRGFLFEDFSGRDSAFPGFSNHHLFRCLFSGHVELEQKQTLISGFFLISCNNWWLPNQSLNNSACFFGFLCELFAAFHPIFRWRLKAQCLFVKKKMNTNNHLHMVGFWILMGHLEMKK